MTPPTNKQTRCLNANVLLVAIANHGRHFFRHRDSVSSFSIDARGRIWFHDTGSDTRIYVSDTTGAWHGFSEGGTLRDLCRDLVKHIQHDHKLHNLGPWPNWLCNGDLWGYGDEMETIRAIATTLHITGV